MTTYKCSKCGISAIIKDEEIIIPCNCNVAIVAELQAETHGKGGMQKLKEWLDLETSKEWLDLETSKK